MAWYRSRKKQSSGGISLVTALTSGVVSTNSAYVTATFNDISSYKYVFVRVYDTVDNIDYSNVIMFDISKMGSGVSFSLTLHRAVTFNLTTSSIMTTYYGGAYYYIYADVFVTNDEILPQ